MPLLNCGKCRCCTGDDAYTGNHFLWQLKANKEWQTKHDAAGYLIHDRVDSHKFAADYKSGYEIDQFYQGNNRRPYP